MKKWNSILCLSMLLTVLGLVMISGCDSGEKARDEITGSRAVKQYHQATREIEQIADKQAQKHKSIAEEEKEDGK